MCAAPPLHLAAAPAGVVFTAPREAAPHTGWFSVTHNEFLDSLKSPGGAWGGEGVRTPGEDFSARSDPRSLFILAFIKIKDAAFLILIPAVLPFAEMQKGGRSWGHGNVSPPLDPTVPGSLR